MQCSAVVVSSKEGIIFHFAYDYIIRKREAGTRYLLPWMGCFLLFLRSNSFSLSVKNCGIRHNTTRGRVFLSNVITHRHLPAFLCLGSGSFFHINRRSGTEREEGNISHKSPQKTLQHSRERECWRSRERGLAVFKCSGPDDV